MRFRNRSEAGRLLARALEQYKGRRDVLVLALPRGGVPVAYEVAKALNAPLDVVVVPTAPAETCDELQREADEVICAVTPEPFYSVGLWYEDFEQTADAEVTELIRRAA